MKKLTPSKTDGSVQLARQIDFTGQSGTSYRYNVHDSARTVPTAGANYVIAVPGLSGTVPIFVGETENLTTREWLAPLERAQADDGKAELLIRLNVRGAVRKQECDDMIAAYAPAMNPS